MLPLWEWPGKTSCDLLIPPLLEASSPYVSGLHALTSLVLPLCSSIYILSLITLSRFMASNSTYTSITPRGVRPVQTLPECQTQYPAVN